MRELWEVYKIPIICGGIGLLIAILFLTLGFLKTLLLVVFTFLGTYLGFYLKKMGFFDQFHTR